MRILNQRLLGAVMIAAAFVLFAMGCTQQRPGAKAQREQQRQLQSQFP